MNVEEIKKVIKACDEMMTSARYADLAGIAAETKADMLALLMEMV